MGYALAWSWSALRGDSFAMPFGPRAGDFLLLMFAIGLFASWLGTVCWNEASQRLPPSLAGQLIVFETLAALSYAYALRQQWPQPQTLAGIGLLVAGVMWALRTKPEPLAAEGHAS
jgi:drug/metabolite transporter (DMT)-like permease